MSAIRIIKLEHVQLALSISKARAAGAVNTAAFSALSNGATPRRCGNWHGPAPSWTHPPLLMPMLPSISAALIDRVRWTYGLAEVQRTWGIGYKALLRELRYEPKGDR